MTLSDRLRAVLRKIVEHSPTLSVGYRTVRNEIYWQRQQSVETPFGFKFIGNKAMQSGKFEPIETKIILHHLADADVFIDIGANIGFYSCLARNLERPVVAIEPLGDNLRGFYRNLEENGWTDVEVWPLGLAAQPGIMTLYGGGTGASLTKGWAGISTAWYQKIAVNTLDNILGARFDNQQLLIKIDVEGAEYTVLKGAVEIIASPRRPVWLIEISLTLHHPGVNPYFAETFEIFWKNGYEAFACDTEQHMVIPEDVKRWVCKRKIDLETENWLFIPIL